MVVNLSKPIPKIRNKKEARELAIKFQIWTSENSMSWEEVALYNHFWNVVGAKFNLTDEFKENGII